jgi:poly-beta-1,6-N-acetyl-D-glucosamine N-deacetylase
MRFFLFFIYFHSIIYANSHIFIYHRFDDSRYKSANISVSQLVQQFEYLKKNNYEVVPLNKIYQYIKQKKKIPSNWIALTIDDAYKSFYTHGLKIFKEYNYPFTLFVYVKATNKKYGDFMTWDMLKDSSKYGEIALHSYSHPHLLDLSLKDIKKDTQKAYEIFEKNMNFKPKYYAYPYGEFNNKVETEIKKFGFNMILNQNSGSVNSLSNLYSINRIALVGKVNIAKKLKYQTLNVKWIEPKEFPKDGVLKYVKIKVSKSIKNVKLYITGNGWVDLKVKDGIIAHKINIKLTRNRTRLIVGTNYYNIATNIIIKKKGR